MSENEVMGGTEKLFDEQGFLDQVIVAVVEGIAEHHGMKLTDENMLSYVTAVSAYAASAIDAETVDASAESAFHFEAFFRNLRALSAHHGIKWSAEQLVSGAEKLAALAGGARIATSEMLARHREEEAKKRAQAEITSRVKSLTKKK